MRTRLLAAATAALTLLVVAAAHADAPANDDFANAAPLVVGQDISATNTDATAQLDEPDTAGGAQSAACLSIDSGPQCTSSVWYAFTPSTPGSYTVETCDGGTDVDSVLGVYTGATIDALTKVADDDDACLGGHDQEASQVTFTADGTTTYHVDVAGFGADQGSFYLRAYAGGPVDRPDPDTVIVRDSSFATYADTDDDGPGAVTGPRHTPSFALSSPTPGATFQCSLDGAAFAACASPVSLDPLAAGPHVFAVQALAGGLTDPTPAIERFTVEAAVPDTTLTAGPTGDTASQSAQWTVAGSLPNAADRAALCGLDSEPPTDCPPTTSAGNLCAGAHTFQAAAWTPAANLDPTPLTATINETAGPACVAPTIGSPNVSSVGATSATLGFTFNDEGAGADLHLDYGPTAAYGSTVADHGSSSSPFDDSTQFNSVGGLAPDTLYHYRVTVTTPYGTARTDDATFTTAMLGAGEQLPILVDGGATATGLYAVHIPFTVDPGDVAVPTTYGVLISSDGPATGASPEFDGPQVLPVDLTGAQAVSIDVVDLDPGTTYHYRLLANNGDEVIGPDATFTTTTVAVVTPPPPPPSGTTTTQAIAPPPPPITAPIAPAKKHVHFRLGASAISFAKLTHDSHSATIKLRKLPGRTRVKLTLSIGARHATVSATASPGGALTVTIKLSRTLRSALHVHSRRSVGLAVSVTPPGDSSSRVSLTSRLKTVKKHRRPH